MSPKRPSTVMTTQVRKASTKTGSGEGSAELDQPVPLESFSEESYDRVLRLCFGALGQLAREGFLVPPDEGSDLIHEFLASQWTGLCERYDPRKGAFASYAYVAFFRFARQSIIRLRSWEGRLAGVSALRAEAREFAQVSQPRASDLSRLREGFAALPRAERDVLAAWLGEGATERRIARSVGVSRYRVREMLVDSIGRIAVGMGERAAFEDPDWEVACSLWQQGYSARDTARRLRRPIKDVQAARHRIYTQIVAGLAPERGAMESISRGEKMTESLDLLTRVLSHPNDEKLLDELRSAAGPVREALTASDAGEIECPEIPEATPPAWVAMVYDVLSGEAQLTPEERNAADELLEANASREEAIGRAFHDLLLPGLPGELSDLERYFDRCPEAPKQVIKALESDASVRGAEGAAEGLVRVGITPFMVLQATKATAALVRRLVRHEGFPEPAVLEPEPEKVGSRRRVVPCDWVYAEIHGTTGGLRASVPHLHHWLVEVASHKPLLYPRLVSEIEGKGVSLRRAEKRETGIELIWREGR